MNEEYMVANILEQIQKEDPEFYRFVMEQIKLGEDEALTEE